MVSPEILKKITRFEVDYVDRVDIVNYYYDKKTWYGRTIEVKNTYKCNRISSIDKDDPEYSIYSMHTSFSNMVDLLTMHMDRMHEGYEYVPKRDLERERKMDLV